MTAGVLPSPSPSKLLPSVLIEILVSVGQNRVWGGSQLLRSAATWWRALWGDPPGGYRWREDNPHGPSEDA